MRLHYKDFEHILNVGIELCTEKRRNKLLASILLSGMEITHCDGATLYLYENNTLVFRIMKTISLGISRGMNGESIDDLPPVPMKEENACAFSALHREIINIKDVYHHDGFDFSGPKRYDALTGYHTQSQLVIPLLNNENELLGVMQLINAQDADGNIIPFDPEYEIIIRSLGSMAAIELTNLAYVEELKAQLRSFVEAFATAVDERTPYNGTHTRKVAEYVSLLANHMNEKHEQGECSEYFDEEHIEKIVLMALLHDIGKMIVPLSVMNRATRLEDQMNYIEMRFQLLKSYYEVDWLRQRITEDSYKSYIKDLDEELEFIHRINTIDFLDDASLEHVVTLAQKTYVTSEGEIIPYINSLEADYLMIRKGTLTAHDRVQMENHVAMTEKILSKVHLNKNYDVVAKWALAHHEFLDGSGYPNHLTAKDLDIETRMLTVADIYDALTACDRPYKKPIPVEKAFQILRSMAEEGKIELRLVDWLEEAITNKK